MTPTDSGNIKHAIKVITLWRDGTAQDIANALYLSDLLAPAAPPAPSQADTTDEQLAQLRTDGWMVAVHNDYRLDGQFYTFWLMTHANGSYVKGEGRSDVEALTRCQNEIARTAAGRAP